MQIFVTEEWSYRCLTTESTGLQNWFVDVLWKMCGVVG